VSSSPRLPRRPPGPASPVPKSPTPLALVASAPSCDCCIHAVTGRFLRDDGVIIPKVINTILVACAQGQWRSILELSTMLANPGRFRARAAACPHFAPK